MLNKQPSGVTFFIRLSKQRSFQNGDWGGLGWISESKRTKGLPAKERKQHLKYLVKWI